MREELIGDFAIGFTIVSLVVIIYLIFFGVWGYLEEKKAAKEKEMEGELRPSLKRDDVIIYKNTSGQKRIGLVVTNIRDEKTVVLRPECSPTSMEIVNYQNIKEIVR